MIDLTTTYGGLTLKTPLIVSSSGLSGSVDRIRKMESSGAGAVVLKSLFEEQIMFEVGAMEAADYPEAGDYLKAYARDNNLGNYLEMIRDAKAAVEMPVIASINCVGPHEWIDFARKIEEAGADALELNIYFLPLQKEKDPREFEKAYLDLVSKVRATISIPVMVKLGNRFTSIPWMVHQLYQRGTAAVVLFNRFYHPDIDTDKLVFGSAEVLSTPADSRFPLRWMGIVSSQVPEIDLAASTGIHSGMAAVKQILAGATAVQVCSVLYRNGIDYLKEMITEMKKWMEKYRFNNPSEFRGRMSYHNLSDPTVYERSQFIRYFSQMH
jgi:dihydroorotate dehydrogenase (fumarate)